MALLAGAAMSDEPRTAVRRRSADVARIAVSKGHDPLSRMWRKADMATVHALRPAREGDARDVHAVGRETRTGFLDVILPILREDYRREKARVARARYEAFRSLGMRHLEVVS